MRSNKRQKLIIIIIGVLLVFVAEFFIMRAQVRMLNQDLAVEQQVEQNTDQAE